MPNQWLTATDLRRRGCHTQTCVGRARRNQVRYRRWRIRRRCGHQDRGDRCAGRDDDAANVVSFDQILQQLALTDVQCEYGCSRQRRRGLGLEKVLVGEVAYYLIHKMDRQDQEAKLVIVVFSIYL